MVRLVVGSFAGIIASSVESVRRILPHSLIFFLILHLGIVRNRCTRRCGKGTVNEFVLALHAELLLPHRQTPLSFSRGWRTDRQRDITGIVWRRRFLILLRRPQEINISLSPSALFFHPCLFPVPEMRFGFGVWLTGCAVWLDWVGLPSLLVQSPAQLVSRPLTLVCSVPGKSRGKMQFLERLQIRPHS